MVLKGFYIRECDLDAEQNLPEPKDLAKNAVNITRKFTDVISQHFRSNLLTPLEF